MEHFRRRSSAEGGIQHLERVLSGLSIQRSGSPNDSTDVSERSDASEDAKGPLGLNLLHAVSEPLVDFIFVHGLGGGSRKTWAKSSHLAHYWPKEWLPRDPNFKHASIHSFGYKADWGEKKDSVLDIHDFAHSLLGEIQDNPDIRRNATRIVLVGHSMGGIVIKKAYILARQDPAFRGLASRIYALYFLATPHRGSDLTRTLTSILKVTYGQKPYVNELERNSGSIATINDTFRHYADHLQLWSFYETVSSNLKVFSAMVVDKSSATLGYANERTALLNADHRNVCKFDDPSDPNYKTLRNAFISTVDAIITEVSQIKHEASRLEIRRLNTLTGVLDGPEDDLMALENDRLAGSCEWLNSKKSFQEWLVAWSNSSPILWLSGNAATGKSILCTHVIDWLRKQELDCSYFFFKHGTTGKSSLSDCLRSLAYQMAYKNEDVRGRLLELETDGVTVDHNDERSVWRKLFLGGVFQAKFSKPHYWVIDALDECSKPQALFPLISKLPISLRVFVTSRKSPDIEQGFAGLGAPVASEQILVSDTVDDIKSFIGSRMDRLPTGDGSSQEALMNRIISMSAGSFLWVRLVVKELERTFSEEAIEEVLNEIPADMNSLYARTLENMARLGRGSKLAKAILTWTVCASRPLTINEIQCALKLDINETVHNLDRSIASICDQLVFVDQNSRVQMIHQTAKDFLLRQDLDSEFAVSAAKSHTRLAVICLRFLASDQFKSLRLQKQKSPMRPVSALDSAFADYACTFFSDHLYKSSSAEPSPMDALCSFLKSNVLLWIEHLARAGDLYHITHTATNLKAYLGRRAKYFPPISSQVELVEAWSTDLIRVSAKFCTSLLTLPSSIHRLIPPMCPSQSIIAKACLSRQRGLIVKGLSAKTWDDCLARIDYRDSQASAVAHGERLFAVGLSNGKIILYHKTSIQSKTTLDHNERVKILEFSSEDRYLASSGLRTIRIWELGSGNQLWSARSTHQALSIFFVNDLEFVMAATQGNHITTWQLQSGTEVGRLSWDNISEDDDIEPLQRQPPTRAVFSSDSTLLAVSYRGRPILLFDIENETSLGAYARSSVSGLLTHYSVDAMVFNPSPEINVLVASYGDGELTVYDLWSTELRCRIPKVYAHSLACSPDGRSLVTGSAQGTLRVFDFGGSAGEDLTLLYRIDAYEDGIKSLAFSADSLRFIDIRGSACRVWEPAILVRRDMDDGSQTEITEPMPPESGSVGLFRAEDEVEITAICCHARGNRVFCGKRDGSVALYNALDGREISVLYSHAYNVAVTSITWQQQHSVLVSADESGRFLIKRITEHEGLLSTSDTLVNQRFAESIHALLVNGSSGVLLVSGKDSDELWTMQGQKIGSRSFGEHRSRTAVHHPLHSELFIVFASSMARLFRWADFEEVTGAQGIKLNRFSNPIPAEAMTIASCQGSQVLTELRKVIGDQASTCLDCWYASDFEPGCASVISLPGFEMLGRYIEHIIGVVGTTLLFLDVDFWVCSLDLPTFGKTSQAKRHFFIPSEWQSRNGNILLQLTSKNEFVFAKRSELVVVKRGLEFSEAWTVALNQNWSVNQGRAGRHGSQYLMP